MKNYSILIIDDEKSQREILSGFLSKKGFKLYTVESGQQGLKMVKDQSIDIILSDFKMPEMTGIEILEEVSLINPEIGFVIITAYGTVENAVKAMRLGAVDYISKPVNLDELEILINRIIDNKNLISENQLLREQLQEKNKISSIISLSSKMEEVINLVSRSAKSPATILIIGENGTGKEVIAKAIHYISSRKDKPFIAINIPALSENLLESELFGHERGSFTGAEKLKKGRFELANGGTILLDEIGDLPVTLQPKGNAQCVAPAREGGVWIGTHDRGLQWLRAGEVREWGQSDGLSSPNVRSVLVTVKGDVWAATDSPSRLHCLKAGQIRGLRTPAGVRSIRALAEGADGTIWAGTSDGQILRVQGAVGG